MQRSIRLPPTTSASQLTCFTMCARKYACRYVLGIEPEFRSIQLILGSAMHSAIGWWFEERIAGRTPDVPTAENVLAADLQAGAAGVPVRWKTSTPESLEAEARKLLRVYLAEMGNLAVKSVETPFQVDIVDPSTGELLPRPMKGYFDLVLEDGRVVELKTSSRGWNEHDLARHLQVGAYSYARNALEGGPSKVEIHVLVKLKREPRLETFLVERGEQQDEWWTAAAAETEYAIAAGRFPPSPSQLCYECEYASACLSGDLAPASERRVIPLHARDREPEPLPAG